MGIEERALCLDDGPGALRGSVAPHKQANKMAVRRVLINPGKGYRVLVQPPLLEVRAWVWVCGSDHLNNPHPYRRTLHGI